MLVKKFVSIKGVARFEDLTAEAHVDFKPLTLIYGDNGSGKTTLAAVFRSLGTGLASYIAERATLGSSDAPEVKVLLEGAGLATFAAGAWDKKIDIEVFDSDFVNENVYAGDRVESEHRKNLYEVVVGSTAVALARRVDEINTKTRALERRITTLEKDLAGKYQAPFELKDFVALKAEEHVQERIDSATSRLNASRRANEIVARKQPSALPLPEIPTGAMDVLRTNIKDVSATAAEAVASHVTKHLDRDGERWLRQGLTYVSKSDSCPFCQQGLKDRSAIETYQQFFSDAYRKQALKVQEAIDDVDRKLSDDVKTRLHRATLENRSIAETWMDLAKLDYINIDTHAFDEAWDRARALLSAALKEKAKNPGETPGDLEQVEAALEGLRRESAALGAHNKEIERANAHIAELKRTSAAADPKAIEKELRHLRNVQIRHEPDTAALCAEYSGAVDGKAALEDEKKKVRAELEKEAKALLSQHEVEINRLLGFFGARFRIVETKPSFAGGSASSTYRLSVNDQMLDLGDERTPRGEPCFRTALSAGDKSALGLAFFLAKIRRDANLGNKAVVFDDPLSSLDQFRQSFTQQEIARIAGAAKQVIVLSHDPFFLKGLRDSAAEGTEIKLLYVARKTNGFTIRVWNVDDYCLHQNHRDYFVLQRFLRDGAAPGTDLVPVARAIRPYVEGALRFRFPTDFGGDVMLGQMIARIRDATTGPLTSLKAGLTTLDDLNTYSRPFHHGGATPVPNEPELQTKVQLAITYVQG